MRTLTVLALILACPVTFAQSPDAAPKRMPGLWEMTTVLVEKGGLTHNFQICVDAQVDDLLVQPGEPRPECQRASWRKEGSQLLFDAECMVEGSNATLKGVFSGDFAYNLQGEITATYTPPLNGLAVLTMDMEGRRLASCRPGQTPGAFMTPVR